MLVDANMMKSHSSSVAPVPTVLPGPSEVYQTAGGVGHRTLWYASFIIREAAIEANQRQGGLHHHGHLVSSVLWNGLQSPSCMLIPMQPRA